VPVSPAGGKSWCGLASHAVGDENEADQIGLRQ